MTPEIRTRAVLTFSDATGKRATFSIPRAKMSTTVNEAEASMLAIIGTNALHLRSINTPTHIQGARLVKTIRTRIA